MSSKPCKFECGTLIQWDTPTSSFKEADGTPHTKERCAYVKSLKKPAEPPSPSGTGSANDEISRMHQENIVAYRDLAAAIRELAAAIRSGRQ